MTKSDINPMPEFFDQCINLAEEENLVKAIDNSILVIEQIDREKLIRLGDKVYQLGKWTVKDIFQHLLDNDRIQAYRALRIARGDKTILSGYDENLLANNSFANKRSLDDILDEFLLLKKSNKILFKSFEPSTMLSTGICFKIEISVLGLGFQMVGHQIHHLRVIEERYFPLIEF